MKNHTRVVTCLLFPMFILDGAFNEPFNVAEQQSIVSKLSPTTEQSVFMNSLIFLQLQIFIQNVNNAEAVGSNTVFFLLNSKAGVCRVCFAILLGYNR